MLLNNYKNDIDSVRIEYLKQDRSSFSTDFGWNKRITICVYIKDMQLQKIPRDCYAVGQTLYFDVGTGSFTGFFAAKTAAGCLCNFEPYKDGFVYSEPKLKSIIDSIN